MKGFTTDSITHTWPIVSLRLDGVIDNDKDFQKYTEEWSKYYLLSSEKNEKFRMIYDARNIKHVKPSYLYIQVKFLKEVKKLTELWMDKTAILISSWKMKQLLRFVLKFYKPSRPFKVFMEGEEVEMYEWIKSDDLGENIDMVYEITDDDINKYITDHNDILK
jgi:hypothetical protein